MNRGFGGAGNAAALNRGPGMNRGFGGAGNTAALNRGPAMNRGFGGAGNTAALSRGPGMNYSRGFSGFNPGGRGNIGGLNNTAVNRNFGMGRQSAIGNHVNNFNNINSFGGGGFGGRGFGGHTVVNNVNNVGNWHRGNWNGPWGGYGRGYGYGGYGRGFGGYGGYGGYGYGGYGGFGSGLLWGLGSGLGFGLGYGLLGGYGLGYGGYGYGGYGGYGMGYGGYGGYGYGSGLLGWGLSSWGLGTWPYAYGYSSYENPYVVGTTGTTYLSYTQPIAVDSPAPEQTTVDTATTAFNSARDAFKAGDYATAQQQVEEALKLLPNDVDLHEFRALTLFAQGRYSESAAALYAVLTAGPGWNWATLVGLYPSVDTFTSQLRPLEQYTEANPNAASARFVLGYLYLTMGSTDAAAKELRTVVRLQPDDRLSRQLLANITPTSATGSLPSTSSVTPAVPAPASAPAPALEEPTSPPPSDLTGTWKADGAGGTSIELKLQPDGHFTWTTKGQGEPKSFSGSYTTGSSLLTLVSNDGLAIVGRLNGAGDGRFRFKLVGNAAGDPGLTFSH